MKDQINFCMTKHEVEIKTLAETRLGGQRFQLFIRRWEMNNEPMPVEAKPEKCVILLLSYLSTNPVSIFLIHSSIRPELSTLATGQLEAVLSKRKKKTISMETTKTILCLLSVTHGREELARLLLHPVPMA